MSSAPDPFDDLQQRLQELGSQALSDLDGGTIVVLPSITFPVEELRKIVGIGRYEERLLCLLLLLHRPQVRMVFVTSLSIDPVVIEYYLSFLDDPVGARDRLTLVTLDEPEPLSLSEKLLGRPDKLAEISAAIAGSVSYLLPFNVTAAERAIAIEVGTPIYGPGPGLAYSGSKSGSRHVAREAGVAIPQGAEDLHSVAAIQKALESIKTTHPDARSAVVKLNYGFSGQGNAIVDLQALSEIEETPVVFCAAEESWASFGPKVEVDGAIAELMVRGPGLTSPSVQLRVAPDGSVEILSTHDQILGGPDDQVYLGCRFPADPRYRADITEAALRVGKILAAKGVIGAFGMDFLVLPGADGVEVFLSEINLRLGGTSHPFYMARFATDGSYDQEAGELISPRGPVCYVATDNLKSDAYRSLTPTTLIEELRARDLLFDRDSRTGVTLHLLGALHEHGKLGATCIALSHEGADDLYADLVAVLDEITS
jgi:PGM1 C-terminal domain